MDDPKEHDLLAALRAIWPPAAGAESLDGLVDTHTNSIETSGRDLGLRPQKPSDLTRQLQLVQGSKVFVGGGGVVLQCQDADVPAVLYALKIPRLSLFESEQRDRMEEIEKFQREYGIQLSLSHPNIAKVFETGSLALSRLPGDATTNYPYLLLEWVEGPIGEGSPPSLDTYIAERTSSSREIIEITQKTLGGLAHLHAAGFIHWDIKADNILVDKTGNPKIMDLGNAQPMSGMVDRPFFVETSRRNLPRDLFPFIEKAEDGAVGSLNRIKLSLTDTLAWCGPQIDLYMLGRELNRVLRVDHQALDLDEDEHLAAEAETDVDPSLQRQLALGWESRRRQSEPDDFTRSCLELVTSRMLAVHQPPYYPSAEAAVRELDRVAPAFGDADAVQELQVYPQRVHRMPPRLNAPWTARVDAVANSSVMHRLDRHKQLATVHMVYSGAQHTRWEHSLGTYAATVRYLQALFADRTNPFFRLACRKADVEAVLLTALLHDLGHVATGHQVEESVLVSELKHEKYLRAVVAVAVEVDNDPTLRLLKKKYPANYASAVRDANELVAAVGRSWAQDDEGAREVLRGVRSILRAIESPNDRGDAPLTDPQATRAKLLEILASIIDGGMDADKFDYLRRDSHHCGVEYGRGIDELRLLQSLTAIPQIPANLRSASSTRSATIGVTPKGHHPLESMMLARYHMFSAVYWQHTVRALTSMLKHAVSYYLMPHSVNGHPTEEVVSERVDLLMDQFRELRDDDAIEWLVGRVRDDAKANPDTVSVQEGVAVVEDICAALSGERTGIYWTVAEVWAQKPDHDEDPRVEDAVYWGAIRRAKRIRKSGSDLEQMQQMADWTRRFAEELVRRLAPLDPPVIRPGEVLLDIPDPGRDQIGGLFEQDRDRSSSVQPIASVTPLGPAITQVFEQSVRRVRAFVHPRLARRLLANCSERTLKATALECLAADLGVEPPQPLPR